MGSNNRADRLRRAKNRLLERWSLTIAEDSAWYKWLDFSVGNGCLRIETPGQESPPTLWVYLPTGPDATASDIEQFAVMLGDPEDPRLVVGWSLDEEAPVPAITQLIELFFGRFLPEPTEAPAY